MSTAAREEFVAFVDLLGFSALVRDNWDVASTKYSALTSEIEELRDFYKEQYKAEPKRPSPDLYIVSDSILVIGTDLVRVLELVQVVQSAALINQGLLARGCVAWGKHSHEEDKPNRFSIVSQPLALAVAGEKEAHYPRVILDRKSGVHERGQQMMRDGSPSVLPCDDGYMMVHPFVLGGPALTLDYYAKMLRGLVEKEENRTHFAKWHWAESLIEKIRRRVEDQEKLVEDMRADWEMEEAAIARHEKGD